ncbi:DUF1589 domain-containing protein [Rhodopirellula baltica]
MLWNKARCVLVRAYHCRVERPGQQTSPGTTWPTFPPRRSARRPCSTWRPNRCFGTKRDIPQLLR